MSVQVRKFMTDTNKSFDVIVSLINTVSNILVFLFL